MIRSFTHYWLSSLFARPPRRPWTLRYAASNLLLARGVEPGDLIYIVTVRNGHLFLAGRMEVDIIVDRDHALDRFGPDIWPAAYYALATPHTATPVWSDLLVPQTIVEQLRFVRKAAGAIGLTFAAPYKLDPQTLRGMRQLTAPSALHLDTLINRRLEATTR